MVNIDLFSSYAKGEENPDSDIDVLVEFLKSHFDWVTSLQDYMEKSLTKKNEIARKRKLTKSRFFDCLEKEVIYA